MTRPLSLRAVFVAAILVAAGAAPTAAQTVRDPAQRPAATPPPIPAGTATISGIVVNAVDPASPVKLARVTLNSVERGGAADTTTTDAEGRYTFRNVPAGRYAIQASKRAWIDADYGAARLGRPGTAVAVRDRDRLTGLTIALTPGAVITGTVRDERGEPQPGLSIRVMRFVMKDGVRTLEPAQSANPTFPLTDDEGSFRAYGLPPGDYIVVAASRFSDSGGLAGDEIRELAAGDIDRVDAVAGRTVTNTTIYFPGTTDFKAAATITLAAGQERTGVDIPFRWLPTSRITGIVTQMPAGATLPGETDRPPECRLTPAGFEDVMAKPLAASVIRMQPDGRIQFTGVPPGSYSAACVAGRPSGGGGPVLLGWADTLVTVDGRDVEIAMAFNPVPTLTGRVVFEGATPRPADPTAEIRLMIRPLGKARLLREFDTRPVADGTFKFSAVVPANWTLATEMRRGSPWTLKSMTFNGRDLPDTTLDLSSQPGELLLTFTDQPSHLTGMLQDAAGRAATEFFVIAFSTDRGAWTPTSRRIQSVRPASDGAFSIKGLPEGEYFLAALTDVEPGEWLSAAFLDQIVAAGVRVKIAAGQTTTQSLRIARFEN